MSDSKNNIKWSEIFECYNILKKIEADNCFEISSSTINEFREARLMTKFDYRSQLPKIFADHNISILPVARGHYVLSKFETFKTFEYNDDIKTQKIDFPGYIESIDYNNITSESTALNCAYISEIIKDFTGEDELVHTVSGRMGSSQFDFTIDAETGLFNVSVQNAQVEVDGGYEGIDSLCLIEAKNSISDDFLIRQVYYPYRLWSGKINKKVRSLFLTYTNGIFHFREYDFENPNHYNSLRLIREKKYIIRESIINMELLQDILHRIGIVEEPKIPFPQANSFERIINLCELLLQNTSLSHDDITENYDFDSRQTDYYTNAGRYLGWIEKETADGQVKYVLTQAGKELFTSKITERQTKFIELILSHSAFNETLKLLFDKGEMPNTEEIVSIMKTCNLYKIDSDTTYHRRASTIKKWMDWILDQREE